MVCYSGKRHSSSGCIERVLCICWVCPQAVLVNSSVERWASTLGWCPPLWIGVDKGRESQAWQVLSEGITGRFQTPALCALAQATLVSPLSALPLPHVTRSLVSWPLSPVLAGTAPQESPVRNSLPEPSEEDLGNFANLVLYRFFFSKCAF